MLIQHQNLLASKVLEKTNNTVAKCINDFLRILWQVRGNDEKVLLMLSDAAPYIVKATNDLKLFYSNPIHVTCVARGFHRILNKIMEIFYKINVLINNGKRYFWKLHIEINYIMKCYQMKPLLPQPIITRWGAWLEMTIFYTDYFKNFKKVQSKSVRRLCQKH